MGTDSLSDTEPAIAKSRWALLAGAFAGVSALIWLAWLPTTVTWLPADSELSSAATASYWEFMWTVLSGFARSLGDLFSDVGPVLLPHVAVPAAGVWLVIRGDALRRWLGVVTLAAWGALFQLVGLMGAGVAGLRPLHLPSLAAGILGVGTLVAALLALRAHRASYPVGSRPRRAVAAAIVLWTVGHATAMLLLAAQLSEAVRIGPPGPGWPISGVIALAPPVLVLLAIAVVVWRYDSLLVVPAAVVVALHGLVQLAERALPDSALPEPPSIEPLPEVAGITIDAGIEVAALSVLLVAVAWLVLAARATASQAREAANLDV